MKNTQRRKMMTVLDYKHKILNILRNFPQKIDETEMLTLAFEL